ncbi:MAG: D-alanyl-D-alanine carboxypeptidase/D-alanyl-D-alanine-endopeptidase [Solirubrobacterales bacterium]|nr:D-alanyl-D-alanine carboxypeptidase/D-alanyl-D-alanine-endopeptidase [Solirubrobacterales bacterium]
MRRAIGGVLGVAALLLGAAAPASSSSSNGLARSLAGEMNSVGGASSALVVDLKTGKVLFSRAARARRMPASVEKIYTTSTALLRFGPNARLGTSVFGVGRRDTGGGWHGTLYLRGGGDPTLGSASYDRAAYGTGTTMGAIARSLRRSGITSIHGQIVGDETYFDSRRGTPATGFGASAEVEGQLSALDYDRGFADEQGSSFQNRPALFATQRFVGALPAAGVRVAAGTRVFTGHTPSRARRIVRVGSPKLATLIRLTNTPSDNYFAEMLLKGIGARFGAGGSTAAGAGIVRGQIARSFAIHPRLNDGSGLSRSDRTSPQQVVTALRSLVRNRSFVNSLAVAGRSGTLAAGLNGTPAEGRCRGKTGTLHDVANLVGYCNSRNGHKLVFAFLMNSVDPSAGHSAEDQMAVALAQYSG